MLNTDKVLDAMEGIRLEDVEKTGRFLGFGEEAKTRVRIRRKVWRTVLIAAILLCLVTTTAYALGLFQIRGRTNTEAYTLTFGEYDYEWPSEFIFEFDGPEECAEIRFSSVGQPYEDYWHYIWETHLEGPELYVEEYDDYLPLCAVDVTYACQFVGGGALVLSRYRPDEIREESWGDIRVLRFQAHAVADGLPEDYPAGNYLLLFHPDQDWIIAVRGYDSMENLETVARGITVEQTGRTVKKSDFENPYDMADIGYG